MSGNDFRDRGEAPAHPADHPVFANMPHTQASLRRQHLGGCKWFALCDRPADGVVKHPILGDVPTCQRCADKLGLVLS